LRKHPKLSEYAIEPKNSDQAAVKIATLTFKYLLLEDFSQPCSSDGELAQRLGKFRFYRHCAFHWVNYLAQANDDIPLFELVDRFIFDSPRSLRSYQQMAYERIDELDELQILYKDKFDRNYELSSALFLLLIKQDITWVVRRILERRPQLLNADVCNFGPPLRIAILGSCYDLANEILTMGADIHMQCRNLLPTDYFGKFGVEEFGVDECRERCIPGTLVGEGRILRVPKNVRMEYIIHTAAQFTPMLLPHFLNSSVDVNIRTEDGASPIHYAVLGNNLEAVEALVNAGAEINAEINGGRTAFHIAISINSPTILLYLLDSNAAVPPDITATEVHTVINSAGRSYLGEKQRERRKSAQKGLSKRLSMIPKERRDCPDISCNWVRSGASRKELRHADGPNTNADLYLSFEFQGTSLKRVQFRLYSRCKCSQQNGSHSSRISIITTLQQTWLKGLSHHLV
jgi:ankyrin repeat protein